MRFVNLEKVIQVDSGHIRSHVVAGTNAYSVGVALPPDLNDQMGIHSVPIPNFTMEMGVIRRAGETESEMEGRFMALLREEMGFLRGDDPG